MFLTCKFLYLTSLDSDESYGSYEEDFEKYGSGLESGSIGMFDNWLGGLLSDIELSRGVKLTAADDPGKTLLEGGGV